ncbi:hypothetical protein KRR38_01320 [Novosphingobium sp. G106]|uniref:hypothetical protein n=1 Tax=Novosphingobium sp. G106 TaxID=2849500 RepID=UPI001C2CFC3F|nr:hypothetical protein [Novosphingobium sp. G106]MBV1686344.1 hypothetical protein [Novosphingobium sp. G106]
MMRVFSSCTGLAALLLAHGASAQEFAKALCDDAPAADRTIDPITLRSTALQGVDYDTLDYDHDGTPTADEIFRALTTDAYLFCTVKTADTDGRAKACGDGQEQALRVANAKLTGFWQQNGALYDVTVVAKPTNEDVRLRPGLSARPWAALLDERGRYAKAVCRSAPGVQIAAAGEEKKRPAFLLGKDIDSLTVSREGEGRDRLAKVTPAEVSFMSDNVADTRTFAIDAVAGLRVADSARFKFTPFLQYSRSEVRDRKAGTSELTGKFAAGAVSTVILGFDQFDLTPLYARDLKNHAELLTGRIAWRPGFLYRARPFNNSWHFACKRSPRGACEFGNGLAVWADFQVISSFGTVLDKGNDPTFIDGKSYVRFGPSGALHIYGLSGLAEDMSLDVTYKRLFRISGDGKPVYAFKADLSYWIAGSEHVSLTSGYERSRDEDTLELSDEWKVALGVRF